MRVGDELPAWRHDVRAAAMVPMAAILRDPNPIHLDPAAVVAIGLGERVINQGPANLAYVINMLAAALPHHRLETLESRFLANVRDGDAVEARGIIVETKDDRITCDVRLDVIGSGSAVRGRATLVRRER